MNVGSYVADAFDLSFLVTMAAASVAAVVLYRWLRTAPWLAGVSIAFVVVAVTCAIFGSIRVAGAWGLYSLWIAIGWITWAHAEAASRLVLRDEDPLVAPNEIPGSKSASDASWL